MYDCPRGCLNGILFRGTHNVTLQHLPHDDSQLILSVSRRSLECWVVIEICDCTTEHDRQMLRMLKTKLDIGHARCL